MKKRIWAAAVFTAAWALLRTLTAHAGVCSAHYEEWIGSRRINIAKTIEIDLPSPQHQAVQDYDPVVEYRVDVHSSSDCYELGKRMLFATHVMVDSWCGPTHHDCKLVSVDDTSRQIRVEYSDEKGVIPYLLKRSRSRP